MTIELKAALYVAGANRAEYQERFVEIGTGTVSALLVREPQNNYDPNAIRVDVVNEDNTPTKVGYVPKWMAKGWAPLLDEAGVAEQPCNVHIFPPDPDKGLYRAEITEVVT
jgi:hypothetical protein